MPEASTVLQAHARRHLAHITLNNNGKVDNVPQRYGTALEKQHDTCKIVQHTFSQRNYDVTPLCAMGLVMRSREIWTGIDCQCPPEVILSHLPPVLASPQAYHLAIDLPYDGPRPRQKHCGSDLWP